MKKFAFVLPALLLCACSISPTVAQPKVASTAPVVVVDATPVDVELPDGEKAQVISCVDDVDCVKKLTGFCANGYSGSRPMVAENSRRVGVLFKCITDQEKRERAQQEVEINAWRAQRSIEASQELADRKAAAAKKSAAKKSSK